MLRFVEVAWRDPKGLGGGGWVKFGDLDSMDLTATGCRTVGYVIRETESELVLFASLAYNDGELDEIGDGLVIPRACIENVTDLRRDSVLIAA